MGEMFEVFDCILEIENGNRKQRSQMQAPRIMIQQEFMSLIQQAANVITPVRITMSRKVPIWSQIDNKWINQEHNIIFANNAWVKSEEK